MLAQILDDQRCLHSKFASRDQDQGLDLLQLRVNFLNEGDGVGCSFTCTVLSTGHDIPTLQSGRDALLLDGRGSFETQFIDSLKQQKVS